MVLHDTFADSKADSGSLVLYACVEPVKKIKHFLTAAVAFFLLPLFSSAQDTTHVVTHYRDGQINDIYRRNSNGEKDGDYIRYTRLGKKYISGHYSNGIPIGIWQFYSSDTSGILVQTLDFDKHKETFVDSNRVHSHFRLKNAL